MTQQNIVQPGFDWASLPGQKFDTTSKSVFRAFPQEVASYLMNAPELRFLEFVDSALPIVETREMDILMKAELSGRLILVHFEIQTGESTYRRMVRRNVGYIGRCYEDHGLPIHSHVVYLRPTAGRNDPGGYFQPDPGYKIHIEYQVIRLFELDGQSVLDSANAGLIPFAPLMQPPANLEGIAWVQHCIEATRTLPLAPLSRPDYLTSLGILSGLSHDPNAVFNLIPKEAMMESAVFRELWETAKAGATAEVKAEAAETAAEAIAEAERKAQQRVEQAQQRVEQAHQQMEQARQQILLQGARETTVKHILAVLDTRFQSILVQGLKPAVEQIEDLQTLDELHRAAIVAPSLEAFTETLVQNGNH